MPTSRCVTSDICDGCTYSTGSSTVMMWPGEVRLRWSIIAASEVDLPEPVAPTTSTRPRLVIITSFSDLGQLQLLEVRDLGGDRPDHHADAALLDEDVDAKARDARESRSRSCTPSPWRTPARWRLVHQRSGASIRVTSGLSFCVRQRLHRALRLHARREVGGDEQVGAAGLAHGRQQLVHVGAGLFFGEGGRHGAPSRQRGLSRPSARCAGRGADGDLSAREEVAMQSTALMKKARGKKHALAVALTFRARHRAGVRRHSARGMISLAGHRIPQVERASRDAMRAAGPGAESTRRPCAIYTLSAWFLSEAPSDKSYGQRQRSPWRSARSTHQSSTSFVSWPELGLAKRDLLQYYADVGAGAAAAPPSTAAMVMKRYPDGADGRVLLHEARADAAARRGSRPARSSTRSGNVIDFPMIQDLAVAALGRQPRLHRPEPVVRALRRRRSSGLSALRPRSRFPRQPTPNACGDGAGRSRRAARPGA